MSVDRLADELWGDHPPPRAAASVQAYISRLRHALEPDRPARTPARVLVTRTPGYALHLEAEELDATRFAREAEEVQQLLQARRFERAHVLAGEALGRWSGEVLADLGDDGVAVQERRRWHELRLTVTEDRLHAAVELGLHATAVADLEQLLDAEPMRERALGLLYASTSAPWTSPWATSMTPRCTCGPRCASVTGSVPTSGRPWRGCTSAGSGG